MSRGAIVQSSRRQRLLVVSTVFAVVLAGLLWPRPVASRSQPPNQGVPGPPDQYIIVFRNSIADPGGRAAALAAQHGLGLLHTYRHAIKGFAAVVPPARLAQLGADPDIVSIVPDAVVTIAAQPAPTGIRRIGGKLSSTISGNGSGMVSVDVAVIDTGIDIDHPDLNVAGGTNCVTGPSYDDGHGHGTHVAGTIGAKDNSIGVVGVAPGARLWAVRVFDNSGSGTWSSVICGVDWVTANYRTIEVANMSLGGSGSEPAGDGCATGDPIHDAICTSVAAGVTYVVAAGNDKKDAATFVPAAYDEVISVSALADYNGKPGGGAGSTCLVDVDDTFANFSNYGADIDLIAPGVCIKSTWQGGGYAISFGTSMASPHAAGAAALFKANNPGATPAQVRAALQDAGTLNWNATGDPDGTKEKLVNVDPF